MSSPSKATNKYDESEVYDRQIRLWGVEAQKRMQEGRVLLCGMSALQSEACKNIVLAGVNVTLQDSAVVTPQDLMAQFFLRESHLGKNRAEACLAAVKDLNPLAKVECVTEPLNQLPDDFFDKFNMICVTQQPPSVLLRLDHLCRSKGKAFLFADTFGYDGWFFQDLGQHQYRKDDDKGSTSTSGGSSSSAKALPSIDYPSLEEAFKAPWGSLKDRFGHASNVYVAGRLLQTFEDQHGRRISSSQASFDQDVKDLVALAHQALHDNGMPPDFLRDDDIRCYAHASGTELSAVCAVVGGLIGQEVIKAISRKGEPVCNVFTFEGATNIGKILRTPRL